MGILTAKYIKTSERQIIVFSASLQHKAFSHFNPISAGFISFGTKENGEITCSCYGESVSLDLKSEEEDSLLAQTFIL